MYDYVEELVNMPYCGRYPTYSFWLVAFDDFVKRENITDLNFEQQLQEFLSVDIYKNQFEDAIVLDENGTMTASRTILAYDNHDYSNVKETVKALELQEEISSAQPVNQGRKDWAFFTWAGKTDEASWYLVHSFHFLFLFSHPFPDHIATEDYYIWEFYKASPEELILSTLLGTASVSFLALLFIPHWSAVFIVCFMLSVLYVDLMGFIQLCGVSVSPVMYISMIMSIGLMVDYVMHVTYVL